MLDALAWHLLTQCEAGGVERGRCWESCSCVSVRLQVVQLSHQLSCKSLSAEINTCLRRLSSWIVTCSLFQHTAALMANTCARKRTRNARRGVKEARRLGSP